MSVIRFGNIVSIGFVLFLLAAAPQVGGEQEPVLLSVVQDYGRPLSFIDPETGALTGFQVEIMEAVSKRAGMKVRHVFVSTYDELVRQFETRGGALTPSMAVSDERRKLFDFTEPYEKIPLIIFVRSEDSHNQDLTAGMKVGAVRGSAAVGYLKKIEGIEMELFPGYQEVIAALLDLRIDAFTASAERVRGMLKDSGLQNRIKPVGHPVGVVQRAIAVKKGDAALRDRLNAAIMSFVDTPQYRELHEKWFGADTN